ncbi:MAG: stage 0 sporulation protein [Kiritimatiellae bacterium]|nr:stage 0 sporulation protein [Verrucomicrobiota bacterium]MBU4291425.1 stage 0 sporulation protein [Verrucomicrobiota bacterium]MCG2679715.1 stage 0 sporulation protein [Kiritimatiellia bacterium]
MFRWVHISCGDTHLVKCFSPSDLAIKEGDACVVELDKIPEFGHVATISEVSGTPDASVKDFPVVLRRATLQDQARASENVLFTKTALRLCHEKISHYQLNMRLLRVRYSFDRSRLMVIFTAEDRVDFRQLVQDLAAETHARIEMRQIGIRDAAAIVGGVAPCGRTLCCSVWIEDFENIHIRMAKTQGLSLNPASVNGMCGRLKCCLRFENNCYQDMGRDLPREGDRVECPAGQGRVLESRVLSQRVKVCLDDRRVLEFGSRDVIVLGSEDNNS